MSNKIIYPILIIIFSVLIIYGIINNRNNSYLNKNFESFTNAISNNYNSLPYGNFNGVNYNLNDINYSNKIKSSAENNTQFTKDMINGTWTSDLTTVDSNYNINPTTLITISLNTDATNNIYGTLSYNNETYNIVFLLNENLIATSTTIQLDEIHIKFYNNFSQEGQLNINKPFYKPDEFNSVVSIYNSNVLINKFASYKVYSNTVGGELYRIISSQKYYINEPPSVYDFTSYNKIIGTYIFPKKYIRLSFGIYNQTVLDTINTEYNGKIKFCIQRVFYSPSNPNTEIMTNVSVNDAILLNAISPSGEIPNNIIITPFEYDMTENGLNSFFKPKATILYFYKLNNINTTYQFGLNNIYSNSSSVLNLKNNSSSMVGSNIQFQNLGSVQQIVTNNYTITTVGRYTSNLNDDTTINFSELYNKL
jgi:hypothetical protein